MRGGPLVRTGAAPEERLSKTKAQRDRERWSVSRAPWRRAAPEAYLGHCATKGGEEGRRTMRESTEGTRALEKHGVWMQVGNPSPRKSGSVFWGKLETAH
ncbi:hypothetical protein NDU88_003927 [Pleurodeles waltl]|uniref:Uncharacterized protein n=1 Tax=Pleurodeles waltl TaxID=8319 RepID=A0AAV7MT16_PLEWA|nr:hypothetical protein NDU88_003927 [Pleurodeles waltl]